MSTLLIKNGTIVTSEGTYRGDVFCKDEKIALIGESLDCEADRVVDASGIRKLL